MRLKLITFLFVGTSAITAPVFSFAATSSLRCDQLFQSQLSHLNVDRESLDNIQRSHSKMRKVEISGTEVRGALMRALENDADISVTASDLGTRFAIVPKAEDSVSTVGGQAHWIAKNHDSIGFIFWHRFPARFDGAIKQAAAEAVAHAFAEQFRRSKSNQADVRSVVKRIDMWTLKSLRTKSGAMIVSARIRVTVDVADRADRKFNHQLVQIFEVGLTRDQSAASNSWLPRATLIDNLYGSEEYF